MELSLQEIQEKLKKNRLKYKKALVFEHEERLSFHVQTNLTKAPYHDKFLRIPREVLTEKKFKTVESLLTYPISTNEITDEIFKDLHKVFFGKDKITEYDISDDNLTDFLEYEEGKLSFESQAFSKFKTKINSIIVCDFKQTEGKLKEPYYFFLDYANVVDYDYCHPNFNYIIFKEGESILHYFDNEKIAKYNVSEKKELTLDYEFKHDLDYCPVHFLWTEYLSDEAKDIKKSPLSNQLSNFDKYLFKDLSKEHLELYASFPIYLTYSTECNYSDKESGLFCSNGNLVNSRHVIVEPCPVCSSKALNGAGSEVQQPFPEDNESVTVPDAVKIVEIPVDSLDYNKSTLNELKQSIYYSTVGVLSEPSQAVNEKQVLSTYESRRNVLLNLKYNFEEAKKFTYSTLLKMRYGADFKSYTYDLGNEWYLFTIDDLNKNYNDRKEAGANDGELSLILDQLIELQYKNDINAQTRLKLTNHLDPIRHKTEAEILSLINLGLINREDAVIHFNLDPFIKRFEREQGMKITDFKERNLNSQIELIKSKFKEYGKESIDTGRTGQTDGGR